MLRLTVLASASLFACAAAAAPLHEYRSLALSAQGERIAAIESSEPSTPGERPHARLVVRDTASGKIMQEIDPCKTCSYDEASWSPDQQSLAFIATDMKAGKATLYIASKGEAHAATTVSGVASSARWSPNGKLVGLLFTAGAKKQTGATQAGERLVGEVGVQEDEQRIAVYDPASSKLSMISPDDTFVYEYDWTPDSTGFVLTSAKGNGDNNWWVATLGHVGMDGKLRILAAPAMQMNMPRVSQDGKTVAYIGGLMSDFGSIGGDVYTVPLAGGTPQNVTPGFKGSVNGLAWRANALYGSALMGSLHGAVRIDTAARSVATLWSAPQSMSASRNGRIEFSGDGKRSATVAEDFGHAAHVLAGPVAQPVKITSENDHFQAIVRATSVSWTNEGHSVQGWLLAPLKTEPGKTYPMITVVHGGPAAAATPRFVSDGENGYNPTRDLTRQGYYLFFPNPRGSYGQGSVFTSANKRDFGGGDWRDILTGVDAAIKAAPIDGERLGLMGHSYGGFMTMWGVTHSTRFKAAVAGAGIANWISYYGQNGIDQWMIPFFGASAYDDPAIYRAASPIETIKAAKTPTLIYVGERDVECPPAQSMEFWHGLKAMNVPTSLVILDGEGHGIRKPANQLDLRKRVVGWFAQYLK